MPFCIHHKYPSDKKDLHSKAARLEIELKKTKVIFSEIRQENAKLKS